MQVGGGVDIKKVFVGLADNLLQTLTEQLADLAVGVLITQLFILDVDLGFDAVEDGVQALLAGLQVAGFLADLTPQQQGARHCCGQQQGQG
jgi:hypothetical protein